MRWSPLEIAGAIAPVGIENGRINPSGRREMRPTPITAMTPMKIRRRRGILCRWLDGKGGGGSGWVIVESVAVPGALFKNRSVGVPAFELYPDLGSVASLTGLRGDGHAVVEARVL